MKISTNLKKINYCPFKPKDQKFDAERLKKLYANLRIDTMIKESIEKGLVIKKFQDKYLKTSINKENERKFFEQCYFSLQLSLKISLFY